MTGSWKGQSIGLEGWSLSVYCHGGHLTLLAVISGKKYQPSERILAGIYISLVLNQRDAGNQP